MAVARSAARPILCSATTTGFGGTKPGRHADQLRGGPTPWGSWLTCEETLSNESSMHGKRHGYVFEVAADASQVSGNPIVGMGRFSHEAAAVDPATGYVYLTEDLRNRSGFYRFVPNDTGRLGSLEAGGRLQAAKVAGRNNASLIVAKRCDEYTLEWIDIVNPDQDAVPLVDRSCPASTLIRAAAGPSFKRGQAAHCNCAQRGHLVFSGQDVYGRHRDRNGWNQPAGPRRGCVWELDLATMKLKAIFVSDNQLVGNNPDNITVSPRGGIIVCEDGGNSVDPFGAGTRLLRNQRTRRLIHLLQEQHQLERCANSRCRQAHRARQLQRVGICGRVLEPSGRMLFCNIQTPELRLRSPARGVSAAFDLQLRMAKPDCLRMRRSSHLN